MKGTIMKLVKEITQWIFPFLDCIAIASPRYHVHGLDAIRTCHLTRGRHNRNIQSIDWNEGETYTSVRRENFEGEGRLRSTRREVASFARQEIGIYLQNHPANGNAPGLSRTFSNFWSLCLTCTFPCCFTFFFSRSPSPAQRKKVSTQGM